jgi:LytS/YehU family sensor histidine kinase
MQIGFEVTIADGIDPEQVELPTMVLQPFVENAVQHGFRGLDSGTIRVDVSFSGKNLLVKIADDGHGFDGSAGVREGSVALQVIRERLSMMQRPGKVEIRLLHADTRDRKGTIVLLKLPLE